MASAAALAIVQGKYILIFEILKRLRAFQNLFFTEGVVTGNGCCNLLRPLPWKWDDGASADAPLSQNNKS